MKVIKVTEKFVGRHLCPWSPLRQLPDPVAPNLGDTGRHLEVSIIRVRQLDRDHHRETAMMLGANRRPAVVDDRVGRRGPLGVTRAQ
jgi:hypothetical protein